MAYIFEQINLNDVVTSAFLNQLAVSTRDHSHGVGGVSTHVLAKDATDVTVVNTTTETTVFTTTIPGGTLSTTNGIRLILHAEYFNNTGTGRGMTTRVKYGGTTVFTRFDSFTTSADRAGFRIESLISPRAAATGTQFVVTTRRATNPGTLDGTGLGTAGDIEGVKNNLAIDSTANQTLAVTVQHDFADSLLEFLKRWAVVEVLR